MKIKSILHGLAAIAMPPVICEITEHVVEALPAKLSLMRQIPQVIVSLNDYLYFPYLYLEKKYNLSNVISSVVAGPIYEELSYRVGMQKILLKDLPKTIFHSNQTVQKFLDSNVARIARIALTSLMFVSLHYSPIRETMPGAEELGNVCFIVTLLGGMWMGALMEWTNNPIYPIVAHIAQNAFIQFSGS